MTHTHPPVLIALTALTLTGAALADGQAELTEVDFTVDTNASASGGGEYENCGETSHITSLDQLPFTTSCSAGISGQAGEDAIAEASARFDTYIEDGLFYMNLRLYAESLAFGNAGGGATVEASGYIGFELAYDSEIDIETCATDYYDNTVTYSLFDYHTGEAIPLDNGNNNHCGFTTLTLNAGSYALMINSYVYDDSGDEWGMNTDGSVQIAVRYTNSPRRRADLDGNGKVDGGDLTTLLAAFGTSDADADLDQDGVVDGRDLTILLGNWGWLDPANPDVNRDGVVNDQDVLFAVDLLGTDSEIADLNRDGIVDFDDLQIIYDSFD